MLTRLQDAIRTAEDSTRGEGRRNNGIVDIVTNSGDTTPRGHGGHRNRSTKIRYAEGSWNPSQFYIGTFFPEEKTTLLGMDGRRKRCLERGEEKEGRMAGKRRMEESEVSASDETSIAVSDEEGKGDDSEHKNERGEWTERSCIGDALRTTRRDKWFSEEIPFDVNRPEINYFTGQWERGDGAADKLGRLHLQFFVEFRDKVRCPQARRYLCFTDGKDFKGWIEPARSSAALSYVRKDRSRIGESYEFGKRGGENGKRGQLDQIFEFMQNGGSALEASTRWPFAFSRNVNSIKFWGSYYDKPRDANAEITVEIYWGVTGSGKSFKAFSENPGAYRKMPGKWWDGYRGEECVVFDEFKPPSADDWKTGSPTEIDLPYMLRLFDRYPLMVEYKGGTCQMRATKFIITSNFSPAEWFPGHHQWPAFVRRLTKILHFKEKWKEGEEHIIVEQKVQIQ